MKKVIIIILSLIIITSVVISSIWYTKNIKNNEPEKEPNIAEKSDEDIILELKEYRKQVEKERINYSNDLQLGKEVFGDDIEDYLRLTNEKTITVNVKISDNLVAFIPYPDFFETQKIYYKDGKLAIFVYESNSIGGEVVYYFEDNRLLKCDVNYEENIEYTPIDIQILINRANNIYENYINKKYEITTEKFEKSIVDENDVVVYKVDYEYPIINDDDETIQEINKEIKEYIQNLFDKIDLDGKYNQEYIDDYHNYIETYLQGKAQNPFINELKVEVKYNKNHILSIYCGMTEFTGGAHPNNYSETMTYDLLSGKKLQAYEYLNTTEKNINNIVAKKFKEKYVTGSIDDDVTSKDIDNNIKQVKYYLTDTGVYFFFEEYAIGPHALGEPFVIIPYEEFK